MNVVLGVSSTTLKLMFKDNMDARVQMYYTTIHSLENSNNLTFSTDYTDIDGKKVIEKLSCSVDKDNVTNNYSCNLIAKLYDDEANLVKTSYFPGDGYKYTIEGETKTKTVYSNSGLETYFVSLYAGITYQLYYMVLDYSFPEEKDSISFNTKINFNFNTFSFSKNVKANYKDSDESQTISYKFDGNDRLTSVTTADDYKMSINYNKTSLQFPSFEGFTEI